MSVEVQAVLRAALGLGEADRAAVAERLLETLPPDSPVGDDEEWAVELDRRWAESLADPGATIPWSALRDESA